MTSNESKKKVINGNRILLKRIEYKKKKKLKAFQNIVAIL